ncbi:MAG: glycine cleavage system aminomethyltransferase GcvT [Xanthobacteraceae bacterium]
MMVTAPQALRRTPLYDLQVELGARMVPFAGYAMPVQFRDGIIKEHLHTRKAAGLFDVSHMGQIALRPRRGNFADIAQSLERLVPQDVLGLAEGRQRYALLTTERGGILDDLMIARRADHLALVVNASRKAADAAHLRAHLPDCCDVIELADRALLAFQGPQAEAVLAELAPDVARLRFMDVRSVAIAGTACDVSRSGYTGEDGFEISVAATQAEKLARALLASRAVAPIGLGARDTLRLEAGLCLYGADLDETTTPVEAALDWSIQAVRRAGGARAGGFPGAEVILHQITSGATRRRVGLRPEGRAAVRGDASLYADETGATPVGRVTSGGFGPTLGAPLAMGYVETAYAARNRRLFADLRGKRASVEVVDLPFIPVHYKRPIHTP